MSDIHTYSTTDASNNSAAPAGFPEGQAPSTLNDCGRAVQGALARWYQDQNGSLTSTGSSNAYVLAANQTLTDLTDCPLIVFRANHANTGAATIAIDGLTAKTIKKNHDQDLASGDIELNQIVILSYNATDDVFEIISHLGNASSGLSDLVDDTTPQLGGDLDLNGNNIDFPTTANISDCLDDDTMATASATTLATSESIKAYVDNFGLPSPDFTSSEQTITLDSDLDVAHSLGARPTLVQVTLRCTDAGGDLGYAQNDEADFSASNTTTADRNYQWSMDATNVSIRTGVDISVLGSTFNGSSLTESKWKYIVRAWA